MSSSLHYTINLRSTLQLCLDEAEHSEYESRNHISTRCLHAIQRFFVEAIVAGVIIPRAEESLMAHTDGTPCHH